MRKIKILIICFLILICGLNAKAQKLDSACQSKYEKYLGVIKFYLKFGKSDSTNNSSYAIRFLSRVSGIQSESDGNYGGQTDPTLNDYNKWKKWYIKNKNKINCDKINPLIYINRNGDRFSFGTFLKLSKNEHTI